MNKHLSAYYFMSTDLCMNRAHAREDMHWLKDHAFDAIHTACHEEHHRQPLGLQLIIEEAHAAGLKVYAIPSRWCGLIAGWPILAGHFAATRPDTWMIKADGSPVIKSFCGPLCSVHHPDVKAHMLQCVENMLKTFAFDGITWDELKTLHETDYHPRAIERFGGPVSGKTQIDATLDIFSACNRRARELKPELRIISFIYADLDDEVLGAWAQTDELDDIGPDGRAALPGDPGVSHTKTLIDQTPRFLKFAERHGKSSFALVETQSASVAQAQNTLRRLPEFLALGTEHVATYYQPLVKEPDAQITGMIGPILRDWRLSR
jgi:hypothetical protein